MTTCWETSVYIFFAHLKPCTNEASYGYISSSPLISQYLLINRTDMHPILKVIEAALVHSKSGRSCFIKVHQSLGKVFSH